MVDVFQKALALGLVPVLSVLAAPAVARDHAAPPPPCPLTATLRIADTGSLAGIQSLSQCSSSIVVAPARPDEVIRRDARPDVRIVPPDADQAPRSSASFQLADSKSPDAQRSPASVGAFAPVQVKAIAPARAEPASQALASTDDSAILAMHPLSYTTPYDAMITRVATRRRIDPLLLHAVIDQESRYRVNATSPVGARGLMQLMPGTAASLNVNGSAIVDAEANVDGGARLLRQLHGKFNDFNLTLAAYNAGEGAVRKYGNHVPPYAETQNYVRGVMARYEKLVAEQAAGAR